jgi:hypothetical protein
MMKKRLNLDGKPIDEKAEKEGKLSNNMSF